MDSAGVELADLDGLSVEGLKALLREQHATLQEQHARLAAQDEQLGIKDALLRAYTFEIEALNLQLIKLRRLQFGNRSEKRAGEIEQLELWVEELEAAAAVRACELAEQGSPVVPRIRKPRREFPAHLSRETRTIAPQESSCPDCGGELKDLGEDVCEILELVPARFKVIRELRTKLACASCDTIVQAAVRRRWPVLRGRWPLCARWPVLPAGSRLRGHSVRSSHADGPFLGPFSGGSSPNGAIRGWFLVPSRSVRSSWRFRAGRSELAAVYRGRFSTAHRPLAYFELPAAGRFWVPAEERWSFPRLWRLLRH